MTQQSPLSSRRQRFVEAYVRSPNASKAAIAAGYSAHTAKQQGSRLLTFVDVAQAVQDQRDAYAERTEANEAFIVAGLTRIAEDHDGKGSDRIRALELLGRRLGLWKDRVVHESAIPDTTPIREMNLSVPELRELVAVMRGEREPRTLIEGTVRVVEADPSA